MLSYERAAQVANAAVQQKVIMKTKTVEYIKSMKPKENITWEIIPVNRSAVINCIVTVNLQQTQSVPPTTPIVARSSSRLVHRHAPYRHEPKE